LKNFIREYFTFNTREKRGLIVLTSIIVLLLLVLLFQEKFISPEAPTDLKEFEAKIEKATSFENDSTEEKIIPSTLNREPETLNLFPFDPNTITEKEWQLLGLTNKQIKTVFNYKNKGGKFFKKEDLKKIYGLSENDYKKLEPYIQIISSPPSPFGGRTEDGGLIELNSADSSSLVSLKGIGPSFTNRIIKYRNLLGGFYKKEQLLEVYGFTEEMLNNISNKIEVDNEKINVININSAGMDQLKKHPYIKGNNAKLIVNYRAAHGNYNNVNEIKNIKVINDSIFNRMSFYLTTN